MVAGFLVVVIAACLGGTTIAFGSIVAAAMLAVLSFLELPLSFYHTLALLFLATAVPAVGFVSGALLDRFCFEKIPSDSLRQLGMLVALTLLWSAPDGIGYLSEALALLGQENSPPLPTLMLRISTSVLFCGALCAFVIMGVILLFEYSAQWFFHLSGLQEGVQISLAGIRSIAVVTLGFWTLHLMSGLVESEFALGGLFATAVAP